MQALAEAIAAEWQAQGEIVEPGRMPMTRSANAALDKVAQQRDEVIAYIAEYGATDLLCYRAPGPGSLIARQAAAWDPALDWAAQAFGARVFATSSSDEKLARVQKLGAAGTVHYKTDPAWGETVAKLTGGRGVDIVIEVGGPATLGQSIAAGRVGATLSLVGVLTGRAGGMDIQLCSVEGDERGGAQTICQRDADHDYSAPRGDWPWGSHAAADV